MLPHTQKHHDLSWREASVDKQLFLHGHPSPLSRVSTNDASLQHHYLVVHNTHYPLVLVPDYSLRQNHSFDPTE